MSEDDKITLFLGLGAFIAVLGLIITIVISNPFDFSAQFERNAIIYKQEFYFDCEKVKGGVVLVSPNNQLYCKV